MVNVVVRGSDGGENAEEENNDNLHGGRLGVKCCSKLFKDGGHWSAGSLRWSTGEIQTVGHQVKTRSQGHTGAGGRG